MIDLMIDRVRRIPVLLIVTFRPEFQHSWVGQPHVTLLALKRLDDRHVATLVLGLAGNAPLGSEVRAGPMAVSAAYIASYAAFAMVLSLVYWLLVPASRHRRGPATIAQERSA